MKDKILQLPGVEYFGGYEGLLKYLERKGNPLFSIEGDLYLRETKIESLGNLTSVGGDLYLVGTKIESLGNLISVGKGLYLRGTPLSDKYSKKQIREMVNVGESIYV